MARRTRLQDLTRFRTGSPATSPVDGFTAPGGRTAGLPGGLAQGLAGLSQSIVVFVHDRAQQAQEQRAQEGAEFALRGGAQVDALERAIEEATEDLPEGEERVKAARGALRRLAEQGVIPATANPAFLLGASRAMAQRLVGKARRDLLARVPEFSAVVDANGDPVDPPDAKAAFREALDGIYGSPLVGASQMARSTVNALAPDLEAEFLGRVTQARQERVLELREAHAVDELIQGANLPDGTGFIGLAALALPDAGDADDLASIANHLDHLREEDAIPDVGRLFAKALETQVRQMLDDNPDGALRLLTRAEGVETAPGLELGRDARFAPALSELRARAQAAEDRDLERAARVQSLVESRLTSTFSGLYAQSQAEEPGLGAEDRFEAVLGRLLEDPQASEILNAADLPEVPDGVIGAFREVAVASERRADQPSDGAALRELELFVADGGPPEEADAMALAMLRDGRISAQAFASFRERTDSRSAVLRLARELPGYDRVRAAIDPGRLPEALSDNERAFLEDMAAEETDNVFRILEQAAAGAADPRARAEAVRLALAGPEVTARVENYRRLQARAITPLTEGTARFRAALDRADFEAARQEVGALWAHATPAVQVQMREEIARRSRDLDTTLFSPAGVRQAERLITQSVYAAVGEGALGDEAVAAARLQEVLAGFRDTVRERGVAVLRTTPPEQQGPALEAIANQAAAEAMDAALTDEQREVLRQLRELSPEDVQRAVSERVDLDSFAQGAPRGSVVPNTLPGVTLSPEFLDLVDSPVSAVPTLFRFLSSPTPEESLGSLQNEAGVSVLDLEPKDRGRAWAAQTALAGGLSVDDVVAGRKTLRLEFGRGFAPERFGGRGVPGNVMLLPPEERRAVLTKAFPGVRVVEQKGRVYLEQDVDLADVKFHRTLSLFVRDRDELQAFLRRPDGNRAAFYGHLGVDAGSPEALARADKDFAERQVRILNRMDL